MQKQNFKKILIFIKRNIYLVVILFVAFFVCAISLSTYFVNYLPINNEKNTTFENAWEYSVDGNAFKEVQLPTSVKEPIEKNIVIKNKMPDELVKGATLLVRTSQQSIEIYIDDVLIYCCNNSEGHGVSSSAYHFIRLPTDAQSKDIKIVISSPHARFAGLLGEVYLGSKASNVFFLLNNLGLKFSLGFVLFCMGLALIIIFMFSKHNIKERGIIYLGAFFACVGFWIMVESRLMQFLIPFPNLLTNLSIFALTLAPIFTSLYYIVSYPHTPKFSKINYTILLCMFLGSLIIGGLSLFDIFLPLVVMPYYLVAIGLYVFAILAVIFCENRHSMNKITPTAIGVIIFAIFAILELVMYFKDIKNYNNSIYLIIGLFAFCVMLLIELKVSSTKAFQESVKLETLTRLAYTDSLTGLFNHTAFLDKLAKIETKDNFVTLAMFDINNLKTVNDQKGHLVGDYMLIHAAKVLKKLFKNQAELYRVGGDEFVGVIEHDWNFSIDKVCANLSEILIEENSADLNYDLSIASGYAKFDKKQDKDLFATYSRADKEMYECKKVQKGVK